MRPARLSVGRLRYYYEQLKGFDVVFNDYVKNDPTSFIQKFITVDEYGQVHPTGLIWEVDDVGIIYLTDIRPAYEGLADFDFWDQRLRGREPLVREMVKLGFEHYGFHRIVTEVALYARPALQFVERVGFKKEGRKREAVRYKGDWFDVNLYSMLAHEVNDVK